jgi:predicted dehydrogenase
MTGMTTPVRWALAGYGSGGRIFHAPLLRCADGVDLAVVVTANPERQSQVAADLPGVTAAPDLAALPALGIEAVTITTPPATHTVLAHQALDLGLDVVVDKPFALDAAAAADLTDHARRAGRTLTVYQNRRWDSDLLTVRRLIADGKLGAVHRFISRIDRFKPVKSGWADDPADGGGTLLDLGPHLVDQALYLFGPVARVHAQVRAVRSGASSDDEIELHLEHASGVFSTLAAGMATAAEGPRFQVTGSLGGYLVLGFDVQEEQLKAGGTPASLGTGWGQEDASAYGVLTTASGSVTVPTERGRWDTFYPAAAAAIRGAGPLPVDPADAVATARVLDAARLSAAEKRVVEL